MGEMLKSFICGMAQAIDIGGTLTPRRDVSPTADRDALRSDWQAVGRDIETVLKTSVTDKSPDEPHHASKR